MRKRTLGKMTVEELLEAYASAASSHGSSTILGNYRVTNRQAGILIGLYSELCSRGADSQRSLLKLLNHPDMAVRRCAATHALDFAPLDALPVLQSIAHGNGIQATVAQMVLDAWRQENA